MGTQGMPQVVLVFGMSRKLHLGDQRDFWVFGLGFWKADFGLEERRLVFYMNMGFLFSFLRIDRQISMGYGFSEGGFTYIAGFDYFLINFNSRSSDDGAISEERWLKKKSKKKRKALRIILDSNSNHQSIPAFSSFGGREHYLQGNKGNMSALINICEQDDLQAVDYSVRRRRQPPIVNPRRVVPRRERNCILPVLVLHTTVLQPSVRLCSVISKLHIRNNVLAQKNFVMGSRGHERKLEN